MHFKAKHRHLAQKSERCVFLKKNSFFIDNTMKQQY